MDEMYIVWAVVIAASLLIEYFTCDFSSICFGVAAIFIMILNALGVALEWQITVFVALTALLIVFVRPICKKLFDKETVPTNADANIGKSVKLLDDIADGLATVKLNDIIWTVVCDTDGKKGDTVEITGMKGNKLLVKKLEMPYTTNNTNEIKKGE
ncbi:MAG: NfeD family protein [Christensenellaceae bacterium]|jgi:membrane protein implicated in regulation of membrane protease activity|nr:NfeD family protein [Christensenellaceae bacterium]